MSNSDAMEYARYRARWSLSPWKYSTVVRVFRTLGTRNQLDDSQLCGHRDCTCGAHGYDTSPTHVQMVDADAFYTVAYLARCLDGGVDVRA